VCVCVCLCIPLSLLGNGSVKVPLSLLGNGYVFYAVRVVSKESRRLVLLRTSCNILSQHVWRDREKQWGIPVSITDLRAEDIPRGYPNTKYGYSQYRSRRWVPIYNIKATFSICVLSDSAYHIGDDKLMQIQSNCRKTNRTTGIAHRHYDCKLQQY
jgi:hypothetical protein